MEFSVAFTYLFAEYTYDVTTEDRKQFCCTERTTRPGTDMMGAPPETIILTLTNVPKDEVWGKSLAELYVQLTEKIVAHLNKLDQC